MAPPISKDVKEKLEGLYYNKKYMFSRDKLFKLAIEKKIDVSRRQIQDFLRKQELYQLYFPSEERSDAKGTRQLPDTRLTRLFFNCP